MELQLAEAIIDACTSRGIKAKLQDNYSPSWMRGQKTAGVLIENGDLGQVMTAIICNPQLFVDGESPRFGCEEDLRISPFRLGLIVY